MDKHFDPKRMLLTFEIEENADGESETHTVPAVFEVCDRCHGRGTHDHPAFSNGFTRDEMDEDPDFREDYFNGVYDVPCSVCHGERVVPVIHPDHANGPVAKLVEEWERDEAEYRALVAAERRMGA